MRMRSKIVTAVVLLLIMSVVFSSCAPGLRPDVAMESVENKKQLKYFLEKKKTNDTITVPADSINPRYNYKNDSFEYNGTNYKLIVPMAKYQDGHRGDAVATISDGKNELTVYEYDYPEDYGLLNISKFLYCPEDKYDSLQAYYGDCGFTYQFVYMVPDREDKVVVEVFEDITFNDETFTKLLNVSSDVCEEVPENIIRQTKLVRIKQNTIDTQLSRSIEFYRLNGEIYMNVFDKYPSDGIEVDMYKEYRVTDDELCDYLNIKMDDCNKILNDDYGHSEEEY